MILLIDNYDSFVHNLARYFALLGHQTRVVRNDAIDASAIRGLRPAALVLSPGPCTPVEAGACVPLVRELADEFPILGVCLGHQCIAAAWGAKIVRAATPMHGRTSAIQHDGMGLFDRAPNPLAVCRYHSLIVDEATLPAELVVAARAGDGEIMALQHTTRPIAGVQFHPEAILTEGGYLLLANFLKLAGVRSAAQLLQPEWRPPLSPAASPTSPVTF